MSQINREALAWAAGLFDGEGWCSSARYSRATGGMTATITLGVGQADRAVLDRFLKAVGIGSITGPTRSRTTQMWAFRVHGFEKVQAVFAMLWPWLGEIKRKQIMTALRDAIEYQTKQSRRMFSRQQIVAIRGWLAESVSQAAIAKRMNCERQRINAIARGRSYKEAAP